jgi:hypothetical protein
MKLLRLILVVVFTFGIFSSYVQIINTTAGTGSNLSTGDGDQATLTSFQYPKQEAMDNQGNIYVADPTGHRVRKIAPNGNISTFAGTGKWNCWI